jgi:hypothetical protein
MRNEKLTISGLIIFLFFSVVNISPSFADDSLSVSGRLDLRGVEALDSDSVKEDPSLEGRIKLDAAGPEWRLHSWLEGGWDGSVLRPAQFRSSRL